MQKQFPILSIDYGSKNIGLAISDTKGSIARALDTLNFKVSTPRSTIIERLKSIIQDNDINSLLIGMPQAFEDKHKRVQERITSFAKALSEKVDLPIIFYDESFTTVAAKNMLLFSGSGGKRSKKNIDQISAAIFLQEYLDGLSKKQ